MATGYVFSKKETKKKKKKTLHTYTTYTMKREFLRVINLGILHNKTCIRRHFSNSRRFLKANQQRNQRIELNTLASLSDQLTHTQTENVQYDIPIHIYTQPSYCEKLINTYGDNFVE